MPTNILLIQQIILKSHYRNLNKLYQNFTTNYLMVNGDENIGGFKVSDWTSGWSGFKASHCPSRGRVSRPVTMPPEEVSLVDSYMLRSSSRHQIRRFMTVIKVEDDQEDMNHHVIAWTKNRRKCKKEIDDIITFLIKIFGLWISWCCFKIRFSIQYETFISHLHIIYDMMLIWIATIGSTCNKKQKTKKMHTLYVTSVSKKNFYIWSKLWLIKLTSMFKTSNWIKSL